MLHKPWSEIYDFASWLKLLQYDLVPLQTLLSMFACLKHFILAPNCERTWCMVYEYDFEFLLVYIWKWQEDCHQRILTPCFPTAAEALLACKSALGAPRQSSGRIGRYPCIRQRACLNCYEPKDPGVASL